VLVDQLRPSAKYRDWANSVKHCLMDVPVIFGIAAVDHKILVIVVAKRFRYWVKRCCGMHRKGDGAADASQARHWDQV
jgi:hypothetical protein